MRENFQEGINTIRIEYSCNEVNLSNVIGGERKHCTAQPHLKRTYLFWCLPHKSVFFPFLWSIYLFIYSLVYLFISDLNECLLGVHSCSHSCHNTPGSYECSCDDGYQLSTDKRHCLGMFLTLLLSWSTINYDLMTLFAKTLTNQSFTDKQILLVYVLLKTSPFKRHATGFCLLVQMLNQPN